MLPEYQNGRSSRGIAARSAAFPELRRRFIRSTLTERREVVTQPFVTNEQKEAAASGLALRVVAQPRVAGRRPNQLLGRIARHFRFLLGSGAVGHSLYVLYVPSAVESFLLGVPSCMAFTVPRLPCPCGRPTTRLLPLPF